MTEQIKRTRIAVCIPAYGTVTADWLIHYMRFQQDAIAKYDVNVFIHEQQPVSQSRNTLVDMALMKDPEYIMFIDSDNIVPPGTIERLLKTLNDMDAGLATAVYFGKQPPYNPVIREFKSGGFWRIDNPALGQQFEIAGCGFGCCIMKAEIFKTLQKPYFKFSHETWGRKDIVLSEDLFFCRQLIANKIKMVCDTGVVSPHIGGVVDVMEYMNFAPIRQSTSMDRDEMLNDMIKFTGRTEQEIDMDLMVGPGLLKEEWEQKNPKTDEEKKQFYKETKLYLYDLGLWHFTGRRKYDIELATVINRKMKDGKKIKVLDLGCGIGQNAIMLARLGAEVTLADLDSYTLDFAEFRFKEHDIPYKIWKTDIERIPPEDEYDIILALDVFEHMPLEEMKRYAYIITELKHKETEVIMSNSFGKDVGGAPNSHPMHYEKEPGHDSIIEQIMRKA